MTSISTRPGTPRLGAICGAPLGFTCLALGSLWVLDADYRAMRSGHPMRNTLYWVSISAPWRMVTA